LFCFSPDKKFILKTITDDEAKLLLSILGSLLDYFIHNRDTLLSRFYGLHGVRLPGGGIAHVVVMANVFETFHRIHEYYDLKGSWVDREMGIEHDKHRSRLGLDLDLKRKLNLEPDLRYTFLSQVEKDSKFLCGLGIMDYSMLLGFHFCGIDLEANVSAHPHESEIQEVPSIQWNKGIPSADGREIYYLGIIDILQLYTIRKKVEMFFKSCILNKDKNGISAVPPNEYSERFIRAIHNLIQE